MNATAERLGYVLRNLFGWYSIFAIRIGWIPALIVNAVVPPLLVMLIGMFFAQQVSAGRPWPPTAATYVLQLGALALMLLAVWVSRLQHRLTSQVAALTYVVAGMVFIAVEAATGAALDLGQWPNWADVHPFDAIAFLWKCWSSPTGWVMMLWFFSALTVAGCALSGEPERTRSPVVRGVEAESVAAPAGRVVRPRFKLDSLAGMADLKVQLREFAHHFDDYRTRNAKISDVNGLLLGGPPGNGKTVFAEALAGELGFGFLKVGVKDLSSQWVNDSAGRIGEVFAEAVANAPCVLFLDEIDAVARERDGSGMNQHNEDSKSVNALLSEIDNARKARVVIVAATNFVDRLDAALVRPGRFDVKIEIPLPDVEARMGILEAMLAKEALKPVDGSVVRAVAMLWERRSAAFIESTVKKLRDDMRRVSRSVVTVVDLKAAGRAASRREGSIPKTGIPLSKLVLPDSTRRRAESIVYRLKNWEALAERGGTPPTGVLLFGPPGTGKTNLVRAMALELGDWHVFEVKVAEMLADPRSFDKVLRLATEHRPAIVFLDEADDLLRDRAYSNNATATNEILKAMDGMMGAVPEVVFVAATNSPDAIDAAAKRGGRFTEKVFMDLLSGEDLVTFARTELARRDRARFAPDVTPEWLASMLGPIGPADVVAVLSEAINAGLTADASPTVERADVLHAYTSVTEQSPPGAA